MDRVLNHFQIKQYLSQVVSFHDVQNPKPNPEPYIYAINKIHLKKQDTVLIIGDDFIDIVAANRATEEGYNVRSILGWWGYGALPKYEINKEYSFNEVIPDFICDSQESCKTIFSALRITHNMNELKRKQDNIKYLFDYYSTGGKEDGLIYCYRVQMLYMD